MMVLFIIKSHSAFIEKFQQLCATGKYGLCLMVLHFPEWTPEILVAAWGPLLDGNAALYTVCWYWDIVYLVYMHTMYIQLCCALFCWVCGYWDIFTVYPIWYAFCCDYMTNSNWFIWFIYLYYSGFLHLCWVNLIDIYFTDAFMWLYDYLSSSDATLQTWVIRSHKSGMKWEYCQK